jgi:hypothetical protein
MAQFSYAAAHEGAEDDKILEMHRDEGFFCFLIHTEGVSTHNHGVGYGRSGILLLYLQSRVGLLTLEATEITSCHLRNARISFRGNLRHAWTNERANGLDIGMDHSSYP